VLCWAFPPKGYGIQENLSEQEDEIVIEGVEVVGDEGASNGKGEKSV
jgi:hypothetical protein